MEVQLKLKSIKHCSLCKKHESLKKFNLVYSKESDPKPFVAIYPIAENADVASSQSASGRGLRLWKAFFEEEFGFSADEIIYFMPMVRCCLETVKTAEFRNCWQYSEKVLKRMNPDNLILIGKDTVKFLMCSGGKTPAMDNLSGRYVFNKDILGHEIKVFVFSDCSKIVKPNTDLYRDDYSYRMAEDVCEKNRRLLQSHLANLNKFYQETIK